MRSRSSEVLVENVPKEIVEFRARAKIAAPGPEIDAAENDFAIARLVEAANLGDDFVARKAAAFSTHKRNDAVGAAAVAAILNFQCGASVISFSTKDGSGEKFGLLENVAGEDFGRTAVEGQASGTESTGVFEMFAGTEEVFGWNERVCGGRKQPRLARAVRPDREFAVCANCRRPSSRRGVRPALQGRAGRSNR